jgi:hypothetical protein
MTPPDIFTDLLMGQSAQRLREMRAQIDADMAKLRFQAEYVDQALAAKQGTSTSATGTTDGMAGDQSKATRRRSRSNRGEAIKAIMETDPHRLWMPYEIREHLAHQGIEATRDAVRVAMKRLLTLGDLERVEGHDGFKLASQNGANADADPGLSENGAGEPPFTATQPQEGTQEVLGS